MFGGRIKVCIKNNHTRHESDPAIPIAPSAATAPCGDVTVKVWRVTAAAPAPGMLPQCQAAALRLVSDCRCRLGGYRTAAAGSEAGRHSHKITGLKARLRDRGPI